MKYLITLILGLFLAITASAALTVSTDLTYTSKYVFRGVQLAKGAFQPALNIEAGDFYATVWNSTPLQKGYELEMDYTAGYSFLKINDTWSLDGGATLYSYPGLSDGKKHTLEAFTALHGTVIGLSTDTYAYYDIDLKVFTVQQTFGYTFELSKSLSLVPSVYAGRAMAQHDGSYTYYGAGLTLPIKLSSHLTVTPGVQWADHNITDVPGNNVWGTFTVNYSF